MRVENTGTGESRRWRAGRGGGGGTRGGERCDDRPGTEGGGAAGAGGEWEGTESGGEEGRRVRPLPCAPFGLETGWGRKRGSLLTLG